MATGNMHEKFGEVWSCGFRVMRSDRQTDKQTDRPTDILVTILRMHPSRDEVMNQQ